MLYCMWSVFSSHVGLTKIKIQRHVGELADSGLRNLKAQGSYAGKEEGDGTAQSCHGAPPTRLENEAIFVLVC